MKKAECENEHVCVCCSLKISCRPYGQPFSKRWGVTKYIYFIVLLEWIFQVSVLHLSIYFSDNFSLALLTFKHKHLYNYIFKTGSFTLG